jgi:hypothetical protein
LVAEFGGFRHETKLGPLAALFVVADIHAGSFHAVPCVAKYVLLNRKGVAVRPRLVSLFTFRIAFVTLYLHQFFGDLYSGMGSSPSPSVRSTNSIFLLPCLVRGILILLRRRRFGADLWPRINRGPCFWWGQPGGRPNLNLQTTLQGAPLKLRLGGGAAQFDRHPRLASKTDANLGHRSYLLNSVIPTGADHRKRGDLWSGGTWCCGVTRL